MQYKYSRAQGTIEYLVIIAIVIVIALVVVGLMTGIMGDSAGQITDNFGYLKTPSSGLIISESVVDQAGEGVIRMSNHSGESITINKITTPTSSRTYNEPFASSDSKIFNMSNLNLSCPCAAGERKKICNFTLEYTTGSGLAKTETIQITTECITNLTPSNPESVIYGVGTGTAIDPWVVKTIAQLQDINSHLDGNFVLVNNIDLSDSINWEYPTYTGFTPIGGGGATECGDNLYFTGTFDGGGNTISGLYIDGYNCNTALFSYLGAAGIIKNLHLTGVNISNIDSTVAGIAGYSDGTIENVSVQGTFSGGAGGAIVGVNYGTVSKASANATINVTEWGGGIAGDNQGTISNSYAMGTITASPCGGIAANSYITINSYSTARILNCTNYYGGLMGAMTGTVTSSYWDTETSQEATSAGGVGKTTAQMQQQSTYSGWDFTNIWNAPSSSYPTLK